MRRVEQWSAATCAGCCFPFFYALFVKGIVAQGLPGGACCRGDARGYCHGAGDSDADGAGCHARRKCAVAAAALARACSREGEHRAVVGQMTAHHADCGLVVVF